MVMEYKKCSQGWIIGRYLKIVWLKPENMQLDKIMCIKETKSFGIKMKQIQSGTKIHNFPQKIFASLLLMVFLDKIGSKWILYVHVNGQDQWK
jgi:hypothetical protein